MSQNVSFTLRDNYTTKIWNPRHFNDQEVVKMLTGEHFFNVIYSLVAAKDKSDVRSEVYKSGQDILVRLLAALEKLESDLNSHLVDMDKIKQQQGFIVENAPDEKKRVTFEANLCPENAFFLRVFILFDKCVSLLSELVSMAALTRKNYYKKRKSLESRVRFLMESYNAEVKRFHSERKSKNINADSEARFDVVIP